MGGVDAIRIVMKKKSGKNLASIVAILSAIVFQIKNGIT